MTYITADELFSTHWKHVVVGRGYAGLVNCSTLAELGKLPTGTLIIGDQDPWSEYVDHPMGQYPALLTLPGFKYSVSQCSSESHYVSSKDFSKVNSDQLDYLVREHHIKIADAVVTEPFRRSNGTWILELKQDGEKNALSCDKIDVCTGPGGPRIFFPVDDQDIRGPWTDDVRHQFDKEILKDLICRKRSAALNGHDFMCQTLDQLSNVVVVGEGPLAANCVEHALNQDSNVTWVSRPERFHTCFPESERYDYLVKNAGYLRELAVELDSKVDTELVQRICSSIMTENPKLHIRFGSVKRVTKGSLELCPKSLGFEFSPPTATKQPDYPKNPISFSTLVISAANQSEPHEKESIAYLLEAISNSRTSEGLLPIVANGTFVGLQTECKSLRILGAASRNESLLRLYPNVSDSMKESEQKLRQWLTSLCAQARMNNFNMGITSGSSAIAWANGYYNDEHPDHSAQTTFDMTLSPVETRPAKVTPFQRSEITAPLCYCHRLA